jgi:hypothetical protein
MVSVQSDVKYRAGCDPSDNYSNELHVSPDLAPLDPLLERPRAKVEPEGSGLPATGDLLGGKYFVCSSTASSS